MAPAHKPAPPRDPAKDKERDYARQRRGFSEYAHALRHGKWRRTQRRPAQHAERAEVARLLRAEVEAFTTGADVDPPEVHRPLIDKWTGSSLGVWVARRKTRRLRSFAYNHLKRPYVPERDRARFEAVLASVLEGKGAGSRELAVVLASWLDAVESTTEVSPRVLGPVALGFLRAFFEDAPEWRARLRAWCVERALGPS